MLKMYIFVLDWGSLQIIIFNLWGLKKQVWLDLIFFLHVFSFHLVLQSQEFTNCSSSATKLCLLLYYEYSLLIWCNVKKSVFHRSGFYGVFFQNLVQFLKLIILRLNIEGLIKKISRLSVKRKVLYDILSVCYITTTCFCL
jgi:hypothetical protein